MKQGISSSEEKRTDPSLRGKGKSPFSYVEKGRLKM